MGYNMKLFQLEFDPSRDWLYDLMTLQLPSLIDISYDKRVDI